MIELEQITHRYGRYTALEQLSLTFASGVQGLLGPNGAGKTTLLRTLATLHFPQQGKVRILGMNPQNSKDRLELRRILGYLPQEFAAYPHFTAFEFVEYIAMLKGMKNISSRRSRVQEVLAQVGLQGVANRKTGSFSGGMRRRLGIAQALVNSPQLLVVDEPTAGLDPAERVRFRHLLAQTQAQNIIFSTHIVEDVTAVASQISVLAQGRLLYQGSSSGLCAHAQGQVFLSSQIPSIGTVISSQDGQYRVLASSLPVGVLAVPPSIEEGYLALVSRVGQVDQVAQVAQVVQAARGDRA